MLSLGQKDLEQSDLEMAVLPAVPAGDALRDGRIISLPLRNLHSPGQLGCLCAQNGLSTGMIRTARQRERGHGPDVYGKRSEYLAVEQFAFDRELKLLVRDHGRKRGGRRLPPENTGESPARLNDELSLSGSGGASMSMSASQTGRQRCRLNETVFMVPRCRETEK